MTVIKRLLLIIMMLLVASVGECQNLKLKNVQVKDVKLRTTYTDYCATAVGCWTFDPEQDRLLDISGEDNHATNVGATYTTIGCKEGGCYDFFSNDYLEKISASNLPSTIGTATMWIYRDNNDEDDAVFEIGNGTAQQRVVLYFNASSTDQLALFIAGVGGGANAWVKNDMGNLAGTLHHLATTWNTITDSYIVYLDGEVVTPDSTNARGNPSGVTDLHIATYFNESPTFGGNIDEFALFDRVLTPSEVLDIYNNGLR